MGSDEADRPSECFDLKYRGVEYRVPVRCLEAVADEIGQASDSLVVADHCSGAVALVFSAMESQGWAISPPTLHKKNEDAPSICGQTENN